MASIIARAKKDGSRVYMVCWRDPKTRANQGITFATESEAITIKKLLDANGQSFRIAQEALIAKERGLPTVAEVIQEHIDLLVRPSEGTVRTYQTMLNLHIKARLGSVPVDKLDYRLITNWIRAMQKSGKSAKTIRNNHALIFSAMETA